MNDLNKPYKKADIFEYARSAKGIIGGVRKEWLSNHPVEDDSIGDVLGDLLWALSDIDHIIEATSERAKV